MKFDLSSQFKAIKDIAVKYWPKHLGRVRTSTVVLMVAFVALFWVQQAYRPLTPAPAAPPGFVPDPDYTWVPRTKVAPRTTEPTTTLTTTPTTTETTTPETTTPETTGVSPTTTIPTTTSGSPGPRTTVIDPDGPGPLPAITLPVLPGEPAPASTPAPAQQPSPAAEQPIAPTLQP